MNKLKQFLKSTIVLIAFSSSLSADTFFQQEDKQKHIMGSMAISGVATGLARHYGSNKLEAIAIGIASALLVGIAKEAIDGKGYGTKDVNDIYADTIGAITGSMISTQLNWRF
jgi:VanZ family protein